MNWIDVLSKTYDSNSSFIGVVEDDQIPLWPLWHITQKAHITVVIDGLGNFRRAVVISKNNARTIIPATEDSAGRTTNDAPHPLCDKLQYVAGDYKKYGGKKNHYFESYKKQLGKWCDSNPENVRIQAVFSYISGGHLIEDLIENQIVIIDHNKTVLSKWDGNKEEIPEIFKVNKDPEGQLGSFIRWSVEVGIDPQANLWTDRNLWDCWIKYYSGTIDQRKTCYVTGQECRIANQHPKKIRNDGDGAKIISSNDKSGYTFRGRFIDKKKGDEPSLVEQTCSVGAEVSQKAHNALRWLIGKQAFKNGDQVIVSWAVNGITVPNPFENTFNIFGEEDNVPELIETLVGDSGEAFALRLKKYIAGYSVKLGSTNNIIVLGLDSASPGRLSITYYRELTGSEFLKKIENWHSNLAWKQRITIDDTSGKKKTKIIYPICAPAPKDIASAIYGKRIDDKLKKSTIERLLPCIIDGMALPRDLVNSAIHRATNRAGLEHWEWENVLGVACSLYRGYYIRNPYEKRSYSMALEPERDSRDYLFGRLLAVAEDVEKLALNVGSENRDTTAAKLMQRFADRPFSTWKTIELALIPYKTRLQSKRPGYLYKKMELLDNIHSLFRSGDYENDQHLSGEFLLGYHCQRGVLHEKNDEPVLEKTEETVE